MSAPSNRLERAFYARSTLDVARALVGARLVRREVSGALTAGVIVETEAYTADDPACHAHRGKTARNAVMFGPAGVAYVYFIYGMYHCLNAVTEADGTPGAVLIRAVEPTENLSLMRRRRRTRRRGAPDTELCSGPGKLCQAFKLDRGDDGTDLLGERLWIEDGPGEVEVAVGRRIGLNVGVEAEWRFFAAGNPHVSRGRPG